MGAVPILTWSFLLQDFDDNVIIITKFCRFPHQNEHTDPPSRNCSVQQEEKKVTHSKIES